MTGPATMPAEKTHEPAAVLEGLGPELGPRVLVTGACGFLGRLLVEALVALGCEVRALDVAPPVVEQTGTDPVIADIRDAEAVAAACTDVDVVFHTAARIVLHGIGPKAVADEVWSINEGGTKTLLAAARAAGVGRFIFTSSHNVVLDRPCQELDETAPYATRFTDVYTPSKIAAERAVLEADEPGGMRTCALRPGGIWGPGGVMLEAFLGEVVKGTFRAYMGDPEATVDNTHIDTLIRAELLAAHGLQTTPERVGGQAYFITDDERLNGMRWFEPALTELDYPIPRVWVPTWLVYGFGWLMEVIYLLGGPTPLITRASVLKVCRTSSLKVDKARDHLGWAPLWSRDTGMAALTPWLQARHDELKGTP